MKDTPKTDILKEDGTPFTIEEYDRHVKKLGIALATAPALVRFLERSHPEGAFRTRYPMGLIANDVKPGETRPITLQPDIEIQPAYLIVSDESAACFHMCDWRISNLACNVGGEPIPLDTMAARYFAEHPDPEKLMSIQDWSAGASLTPANRLTAFVKNVTKETHNFRAIVWSKGRIF